MGTHGEVLHFHGDNSFQKHIHVIIGDTSTIYVLFSIKLARALHGLTTSKNKVRDFTFFAGTSNGSDCFCIVATVI